MSEGSEELQTQEDAPRAARRATIGLRVMRVARKRKVAVPTIGALLVALTAVVWATVGIAAATFVVVAAAAVFSAIPVIGWKPFDPTPEIAVGFRIAGKTQTSWKRTADRSQAMIDVEAIIAQASLDAQQTLPPPTGPRSLDLKNMSYHPDMRESERTARARFDQDLLDFAIALRAWLEAYERLRGPSYSVIKERIAIRNSGESVAEGITLNLRLPSGWAALKDEDLLSLGPPPESPKYERESVAAYVARAMGDIQAVNQIPSFPSIPFQGAPVVGPEYLRDGDNVIVQFRLAAITHGVTLISSEPVLVIPRRPGKHVITWEAHAANLRRPIRGEITIEVEPLPTTDHAPLCSVAEVLASGGVHVRNR